MRIAVIGTGIAGNAAAWALSTCSPHDVTVYERETRPGGHCRTIDADYDGVTIPVDTGFMVYNDLNYPNLAALFAHLGVATQPASMSFSVSVEGGSLEWAGDSERRLQAFFAQKRNLVSLRHFRMLGDIMRFNRRAVADFAAGRLRSLSLGEYLDRESYSPRFRNDYLLAMGAAIWSTSPAKMLGFPAESFVAFCENHRLMHWKRPQWRTVVGGSRAYVETLVAPLHRRTRFGCPAASIRRVLDEVEIVDGSGHRDRFDAVLVATHSDEALALLDDPSPKERAILGAISYCPNEVCLHRDPALMPRRRAAWSSWNLLKDRDASEAAAITYWMNRLQGIDPARPVFVSLNPNNAPRENLVFGRFTYRHPQYDQAAIRAQGELPAIQGVRGTWFCGAWTRYGFHEDGLVSGLAAAEALGAVVPWRLAERRLPAAAE